jgi:hypothetical protein
MTETINLEQAVLDNLRVLPNETQQLVLDFVEFLVQKTGNKIQPVSEVSNQNFGSTVEEKKLLSLKEIAKLPVAERHKILSPYIAATAADFLTDSELTEFSVLDGEDWEIEHE